MNYAFVPSLQRLSLVSVAIGLWNRDEIVALTREVSPGAQNRFPEVPEEWKRIENKLRGHVEDIPLPETLKRKLSRLLRPIGVEILRWMEYHEASGGRVGVEALSKVCWTMHGTVDKKKTAEALIREEGLDPEYRYQLACMYCLHRDIPVLWEEVCGEWESGGREVRRISRGAALVEHWTLRARGPDSWRSCGPDDGAATALSADQHAFKVALESGNEVAAGYFLERIPPELARDCLFEEPEDGHSDTLERVREARHARVAFFLLSRAHESLRGTACELIPLELLRCLLDWPLQGFFVGAAREMRRHLDEVDCLYLVSDVVEKMASGYEDHDYRGLLGEFWVEVVRRCADASVVVGGCLGRSLFSKLSRREDSGLVELIMEDATPEQEGLLRWLPVT